MPTSVVTGGAELLGSHLSDVLLAVRERVLRVGGLGIASLQARHGVETRPKSAIEFGDGLRRSPSAQGRKTLDV